MINLNLVFAVVGFSFAKVAFGQTCANSPVPQNANYVTMTYGGGSPTSFMILEKYTNCIAISYGGSTIFGPTTCSNGNYYIEYNNVFRDTSKSGSPFFKGTTCGDGAPPACGSGPLYTTVDLPCLPDYAGNTFAANTPITITYGGSRATKGFKALGPAFCQCIPFSYSGNTLFAPYMSDGAGGIIIEYNNIFRDCTKSGSPQITVSSQFPGISVSNPPNVCNHMYNFGRAIA
ncbi:UNVERIFIED_CONTAM: hypothetical protein HDU68_008376 [Siphonaria sp. JEL0065]|nr:hypothetical protein HDU68_008376 [Siphonaria sp. JEL0065]